MDCLEELAGEGLRSSKKNVSTKVIFKTFEKNIKSIWIKKFGQRRLR